MAEPLPPSMASVQPTEPAETPAEHLARQHSPTPAPTLVETAPAPVVTAESLVQTIQQPPAVPATAAVASESSTPPVPLDPSGTRPTSEAEQAGESARKALVTPDTPRPSSSTSTLAPPPPSSTSEPVAPTVAPPTGPRRSVAFAIPPQLIKPGVEMLKVSRKSARRVKPRKLWLEVGGETPEDGELGLELGVGMVGGQDVRLCWEKNGLGIGLNLKKDASVPLSRIKDLRFGTQGSPYRTSLQISKEVEPRWITVIYTVPQSSRLSNAVNYKLVHFIAPTVELVELWRTTLERFKEGRVAKAIAEGEELLVSPEVHAENEKRVVKEAEVHQLCARLGVGMGRTEVSAAFRKTAAPRDYLDFAAFQEFVKLLKRREEVEMIFRNVVGAPGAFSEETWGAFLSGTQKLTLTPEALSKSFTKYADRETKRITLDGFGSYLMSSDNAALRDESSQDMTRPISEYFISSSHNTYLIGSQFQGESTVEGYIRALQQGCRCVELDVWDGDDGEPIVTHGLTLTSKISVREVLEAIAQYAFLASPYPVLLSMEVHCSVEQQDRLVDIMKQALGDKLVQRRLEEDDGDGEIEKLPSPMELKGKILLKAKNKVVTTSNACGLPIAIEASHDPSSSSESTSTSSDSEIKRVFRAVRQGVTSRPSLGSRSSRSSSSSSVGSASSRLGTSPTGTSFFSTQGNRLSATLATSPPAMNPPPPPPKEGAQSSALLSLLVYTVGVKARGFNKKESYAPTHVISVGEGSLTKMIRDEGARQDFVAHNRGHLTRAYPKGSRLTSSNYAPQHMWAVGVQMVALNWQTFDVGMELNAAMFARASRSGYVLKPELLRRKGAEKDKSALIRSEKYVLELEIISAQQLPRPRDASSTSGSSSSSDASAEVAPVDPFIEVSLYQPGLLAPIRKRTKVVVGNSFNPIFKSTFTIPFSSHPSPGMLDLIFLRLEVLNAKGNLKSAAKAPSASDGEGGRSDFEGLGAYTVSLGCLLSGYRHVPLYDAFGDQHLFSTVFIKSNVVATGSVG